MVGSNAKDTRPKSRLAQGASALMCAFSLIALLPGACAAQAADEGGKDRAPVPAAGVEKADAKATGRNLEVLEARFEPIAKGKNIVRVSVQNLTAEKQVFAVHIQTRSSNGGWGTQFFEEVTPRETKECRFAFNIRGDVTEQTMVRLHFYNPASIDEFVSEEYFLERKYNGLELERRKSAAAAETVPAELTDTLIRRLKAIQNFLGKDEYEKVWSAFTRDYQQAEWWQNYGHFEETMRKSRPTSWWSKGGFLALEPQGAARRGDILTLTARSVDKTWTVDFARDGDEWKIDWIDGYAIPVAASGNWMERLLPKMEKRTTEHFDIYYFKGSTAERDIDAIAQEREKVFKEVFEFFATPPHGRARLILFEDKETKRAETGHQGAGWAFDNNMVEVYSDTEKVDPAHELTHVIAGGFGEPPAILNEGLGVYMEKGHEWHGVPVDLTTAGLVRDGRFVPLIELLKRTEIGARHDDGEVAYPESASFVKFVVDKYEREKFLELYRRLRNGDSDRVLMGNVKIIKEVLGKDVDALEEEWKKSLAAEKAK